jgi:carboxyl-terminal processing protease
MRFLLAVLAAAAIALSAHAQDSRRNLEDFDAMWRAVDEGYAYFDGSRARWKRSREAWRGKARAARTSAELAAAIEGALAELRDEHVTLSERTPRSARHVPAESDIWAEWRDGKAIVTAVRVSSEADAAGLHPGHIVTHIQGVAIERAVREGMPARDAAALDWRLRRLLAGPRAGPFRLTVEGPGGSQPIEIERHPGPAANGAPILARRVGEDRDIGYLRIRNARAHPRLAEHFDGALGHLKDTRALILDLREIADGAPRALSEAILAHFVDRETPWQLREGKGRARSIDRIAPNPGATAYRGRLVVLVDRWTAGEGEALAAGLDALGATLVGTPMAGLRGEPREARLPHSGFVVRFPAQKVYHVNGTPRESLRPAVAVDLAAPSGGPGDPILYQALKLLEGRPACPAPADRSARH